MTDFQKIERQIEELTSSQGYGGNESAAQSMRLLLDVARAADPKHIPFDQFRKPVCRGSGMLRNNCGRCEKCEWMAGRPKRLKAALTALREHCD